VHFSRFLNVSRDGEGSTCEGKSCHNDSDNENDDAAADCDNDTVDCWL